MPRPAQHPILFDELFRITVTDLRRVGLLRPQQISSGTIRCNEAGETVHVTANLCTQHPYIEFFQGETRRYRVRLAQIPSNLNKGHIYRFVCPVTQKRCRMLYFIDGYFVHRTAVKGMYYIQTQSKQYREFHKAIKTQIKLTTLLQKHFRMYYKGKPTKRYLRLMK